MTGRFVGFARALRMGLFVVGLSGTTLAAVGAPLAAQETPRRGLWGGFGLAGGSIGCDGCTDRTSGFAGFGVIGGTLSDVVRIGGGVNFFTRDDDGSQYDLGAGLFIVQVFPARGDFFFQGGAGFASSEIDVGDVTFEDEGAAFLIGLGYNVNLGQARNLALVPFANWIPTSVAGDPDMLQIGVGLVWN